MTEEQFVFWLKGFFDLTGADQLVPWQVAKIREELAKVDAPKA